MTLAQHHLVQQAGNAGHFSKYLSPLHQQANTMCTQTLLLLSKLHVATSPVACIWCGNTILMV
jgi:hypothetical protein